MSAKEIHVILCPGDGNIIQDAFSLACYNHAHDQYDHDLPVGNSCDR